MATDLSLHEEVLLLALKDEAGTIDWRAGEWLHALAGALVTELLLAGRIEIEGDKQFVNVVDNSPLSDAALDECLERIAAARRRKRLADWVAALAGTGKLKHLVAEGLCRKGVLREDEGKVLLFFTRRIYPEVDPVPEDRLIQRLRNAIFNDAGEVDPRTTLLISLAHASGLLGVAFPSKELRRRKQRIEQIARGEMVGQATREAVEAAAAAGAAVAGSIAAAAAASSGGDC